MLQALGAKSTVLIFFLALILLAFAAVIRPELKRDSLD